MGIGKVILSGTCTCPITTVPDDKSGCSMGAFLRELILCVLVMAVPCVHEQVRAHMWRPKMAARCLYLILATLLSEAESLPQPGTYQLARLAGP